MADEYNSSGVELKNLDPESKKAPERRLKDAGAGRRTFWNLQWADQKRNLIRARHQAQLDGEPPYDQTIRAAKGQGSLTNVNWLLAKEVMDNIMSGAVDMNASVEQLLNVPLNRWAVPDDAMRANYENILSSELSRCIRGWEGYDRMYLTAWHYFAAHGVGIQYFEDAWDWRPEITGLGDFVVPDDTGMSEDCLEIACCRKYISLHKLYKYIKNEKAAKAMGWNVAQVKKAMMKACPETVWDGMPANWQRLENMMRNNDLGMGYGTGSLGQQARTAKVCLLHFWVAEFDGTVSKCITTQDAVEDYGKTDEPWLYDRPHVYPEMRRGIIFYPFGIGDNGMIHSVSGILRMIFSQCNALNRAQSLMLDASVFGASVMFQPETEASISRMNLIQIGPMTVTPAKEHGMFIDRKNPDVAGSVMPVIADLRAEIKGRAGQFQGGNSPFGGSQPEKTRFQVAAELEALGKVGATQGLLWYQPWTRSLREMARRICRPGYQKESPGGQEVHVFIKRLKMRGFPVELLAEIDYDGIMANRAVGAGSGAARIGRLENLRQLAPEYDATGRYNLVRDLTAAQLGGDYDLANRYMPPQPGTRPPIDEQIADLENLLIKQKEEPKVVVNQDHWVHLGRHFDEWGKMVGMIESGEVEQTELAEQMMIFQAHTGDHLAQVNDSQIMQEQAAQARQIYQQLSAITDNVVRKAIAEQQKAMEEEMEQGAQGQVDPALQQKAMEARLKVEAFVAQSDAKLAFDEAKHEQDMRQKQESFRMTAAHKDADKAADLVAKVKERFDQSEISKRQKEQTLELAKLKAKATANKPKPKKK